MYSVEGIDKVYNVHVESSLLFGAVFNNISQRENMIDTTSLS